MPESESVWKSRRERKGEGARGEGRERRFISSISVGRLKWLNFPLTTSPSRSSVSRNAMPAPDWNLVHRILLQKTVQILAALENRVCTNPLACVNWRKKWAERGTVRQSPLCLISLPIASTSYFGEHATTRWHAKEAARAHPPVSQSRHSNGAIDWSFELPANTWVSMEQLLNFRVPLAEPL